MYYKNKRQFSSEGILRGISMIMLCAFLNLIIGCSYYKVTTSPADMAVINHMQKAEKYVIIHQGTNAWHLKDVTLNEDKKEITGTTEFLPKSHQYYLTADTIGANRFVKSEGNPTYEVHFYISEYAEGQNSQVTIALSSIKKIEIYDVAVGATTASYLFSTLGVIAIVVLIIALVKSSCPFVYINNGTAYRFAGEMYGGAIYSSLERDDFMPLPGFIPSDGEYQLRIANELLERQYTNLADLIVVEHPEHSEVILDKQGNIQTILKPQSPVKTLSDNNIDYTNAITSRDSNSYLFNESAAKDKDLSSLVLSFKKPLNSKTGKLILNAKNSFWLDYVYGKFNEQFGRGYHEFAEKQKKVPAKKNIQWALEQGIPLSVSVETQNGWEPVDYFNVMGPLASRDIVMPVDLSKVKGEDVKIKLECGFMFWEIDYAAMDFSKNIPVEIRHLTPLSALDENGKDVTAVLAATDDQYLIQPVPGNAVTLKYPAVAKKGNLQTFFLHSRGYYEYIRDYKGKPNLAYLNSFRKKGAFTKFSKERYSEFIGSKDFLAKALTNGN